MTFLPANKGVRLGLHAVLALSVGLTACSKNTGSDSTVTVQGDVAIAYVKRSTAINANPTNGAPSAPGGDLMVREKSSPSAPETNVTASITQGVGDASDPEVSYDGKKIVFALKCPASNTSTVNGAAACTGRWNIWEYDMSTGGLKGGTLRRITSSTTDDDVDPAYLPAGRGFVFTSNRQTTTKNNQINARVYFALDEYERERVFNLHTMDAQGGAIAQISSNQSHDRNPVVRPNGDIMFSRWDHVGGRNHFKVFRVKPDGTDMFVLYGAHSAGNSFLHPRDMDPNGQYKGHVSSDLMPLQRTHEGGALVFVDAANYSEQNTPANSAVSPQGGQKQATAQPLNIDRGLSLFGRVTTPYPLWDGTDRVLVGYAPCQVTKNGVVVACATLSQTEIASLSDTENMTNEQLAALPVKDNVKPQYGIYMFNPANQTFLIVAAPPVGFMYTDPVAIQSRTEPQATDPTSLDTALQQQNLGLIEVRSVYDTDGLGRMGDAALTANDIGAGCTAAIAKTAPADANDTRPLVADLAKMKDPANAAYGCAPARFIRVFRAVAPPEGSTGMRSAIGNTDFEMQQILGYAPIEPDGSFKLLVPADVPLGLAVTDADGLAFQTHTNWIQVRPGERRTCDGCHSPRRGAAINSGTVVNSMPTGLVAALAGQHQSGETMASTRTRLDANLLRVQADPVFTDVWADTSKAGVVARPSISLKYTGNPVATDDLQTTVPTNGIINYPDHIQPLWTRARTGGTCVSCHADPTKLDLTGGISGTGRLTSYEELTLGDPVIDATTGLPQTRIEDGVPVVVRGAALVDTDASEGEALGLSRKSRLIEIATGKTFNSGAGAQTAHPTPALDHSTMLNKAEKRLVAEWIDLGSKYYNDPFNGNSGVRTVNTLSRAAFEAQVYPIMQASCMANCHQAVGSANVPAGTSFLRNRLVLTGDAEGDFNVTLTMITNACAPASNYLLSRPSTAPHPPGAVGQATAPLPAGSANYTTIANWIQSGCTP